MKIENLLKEYKNNISELIEKEGLSTIQSQLQKELGCLSFSVRSIINKTVARLEEKYNEAGLNLYSIVLYRILDEKDMSNITIKYYHSVTFTPRQILEIIMNDKIHTMACIYCLYVFEDNGNSK